MAHGGYKREVRGRGLESRGVAQAERWDSRTQLDYGPPLGEMSAYVRHTVPPDAVTLSVSKPDRSYC